MKYEADFRAIARDALRGKWPIAVLTGFVASLLGAGIASGGGGSRLFRALLRPIVMLCHHIFWLRIPV